MHRHRQKNFTGFSANSARKYLLPHDKLHSLSNLLLRRSLPTIWPVSGSPESGNDAMSSGLKIFQNVPIA